LKPFRFLVFVAAIVLGGGFLASCRSSHPAGRVEKAAAVSPDQVIRNFSIDSFAGKEKDWHLESPRADIFESENRIRIQKPSIRFFENSEPSSSLEAGAGEIQTSGARDLWAWDQVVMTSTDGARLTSEWLHYISEKERIVSTAPVTIVRPGTTIQGVGWEATPDLSEVLVRQQRVEIVGETPLAGGKGGGKDK